MSKIMIYHTLHIRKKLNYNNNLTWKALIFNLQSLLLSGKFYNQNMHLRLKHICDLKVWLFLAIASLCFVSNSSAQRTSEKHVNLVSNTNPPPVIDVYPDMDVADVRILGQQGLDYSITTDDNNGDVDVKVNSNPNITGDRSFTIEYLTPGNPNPLKNYRIYYLHFTKSVVKANDDLVTWNGVGSLTIDILANDVKDNVASIKINQKSPTASVTPNGSNQLVYNNTDFSDFDYIHYTLTDSTGTSDQGIVKIELAQSVPTENEAHNFVVNYLSTKNITVPAGFTKFADPQNGTLSAIDSKHFLYTPQEYYIGADSFVFKNSNDVTITYAAKVIDAERDPGIVKNDVFYTPKGQAITFDVFANDMTDVFEITQHSSGITHDTLGIFTYTPGANFTGQKSFTYKINNGSAVETGVITIHVGNQQPMDNIVYEYDVLAGKDFVIEYTVPIDGYSFSVIPPSQQPNGAIYTFVDSTEVLACGKTYGKAMIVYSAALPNDVDTFNVRYCINTDCKTYKIVFKTKAPVDPLCNCIDDCVWSGDLNGDGRVSGADLLVLGRYFGYRGTDRDVNNETIWTGDNSTDWGTKAVNGKDLKYADSNGDGILDETDKQAIVDNFGKLNSLVPTEQLAYKDYQLSLIPDQDEYEIGDTATIYIYLGTANKPANGLHGLSFGVNFDGIDSFYHDVKFYNNSWLSDHSPLLQIYKQAEYGQLRTAVSRTSGKGSSGFGLIGQMSIIIDEVDGVKTGSEFITSEIISEDIYMEDGNGNKFLLPDVSASLKINLREKEEQSEKTIKVYPNPSSDFININALNNTTMTKVNLINTFGFTIISNKLNNKNYLLDVSQVPSGVYFVRVESEAGIFVEKVVVE